MRMNTFEQDLPVTASIKRTTHIQDSIALSICIVGIRVSIRVSVRVSIRVSIRAEWQGCVHHPAYRRPVHRTRKGAPRKTKKESAPKGIRESRHEKKGLTWRTCLCFRSSMRLLPPRLILERPGRFLEAPGQRDGDGCATHPVLPTHIRACNKQIEIEIYI